MQFLRPPERQLTMEQYWGEAEGHWDALAAELRAARGALAAPAGLRPHADRIDDLHTLLEDRLHASEWVNVGSSVAVTVAAPGFRRALLAASDEIIATNAVFSPILAAFLRRHRVRPDLEEVFRVAAALQSVAVSMLISTKLYKQQGPKDDLQPRVCAASVAIMDTGGLLFDLFAAGHIGAGSTTAFIMQRHRIGLEKTVDYLDGMRYAGWRGGGLERLRATTHSPTAILGCLRRLLREPPCINMGLGFIMCTNTMFSEERDTLEADRQLLTALVDHLESGLQRVATTAATLRPVEKLSALRSTYDATTALGHIDAAVFLDRATRSPALLQNVAAILDACIADPPAGDIENIEHTPSYMWAEAATACLNVMFNVLKQGAGLPEPVVSGQLLGFLRRAVATATVLEEKGAPPNFVDGKTGALLSLCMILDGPDDRGAIAFLDSIQQGHCLEGLQSLEGILRLAARASWRSSSAAGQDLVDLAVLKASTTLLDFLKRGLAGEVLPLAGSDEGLAAISGIVESGAKLGLWLATLPAPEFTSKGNELRADLLAFTAAFMILVTTMRPLIQPPPEHAAMRQVQAQALAVCSAAAALERCQVAKAKALASILRMLLLGLTQRPEVFSLVVKSEAGGPAVARALEFALESNVTAPNFHPVFAASAGPGGEETAAALARLGILTQLARWAELRCRAGDAQEGVLKRIIDAVSVACASSETEAMAGCCSRLAAEHGPSAELQADFWVELAREVTAPLAAELVAKAAADLQLEVDIAKALATRRCACLACTRIVGPSEAGMPFGRRCSGCRLVHYCGAACQRADWRAHKAACRELQARRGAAAPQGPA